MRVSDSRDRSRRRFVYRSAPTIGPGVMPSVQRAVVAGFERRVHRGHRRLLAVHAALSTGLVLGGGAATALAIQRAFLSEDGVSYLDLADAFGAGDWSEGINAYWSPLYPLMLAGALRVLRSSAESELVAVHLVNLAIFVLGLMAFVAFWAELDRHRSPAAVHETSTPVSFSPTQWWVIGYLLFGWCALRLIKVWTTTPDMAVLAIVLFAGTLLLRMHRAAASWTAFALFGLCLGVGYLAKAAMFPVALVLLVAALGTVGTARMALSRVGAAILLFVLIASPVVLTLSARAGYFTFGDAGRLNYARYVNGVPDIHWRGEIEGSGTPAHPTRQLTRAPAAFEFAEPIRGTYPVWYDPAYWYKGVQTPIDPGRQIAALVRTGAAYADLFLARQGAAVAILVLLFALQSRRTSTRPPPWHQYWMLWLPAVSGFALYALVYVEPRYVAPFLILAWGAALAVVRIPAGPLTRPLLQWSGALVAMTLLLNLAMPNDKAIAWAFAAERTRVPTGEISDTGDTGSTAKLPAAQALTRLGLRPGDGVAVVGNAFQAYWARLARLRIVAEVPDSDADRFWQASASRQGEVLAALFSTGARAVVAMERPGHRPPARWHRLGDTGFYVAFPESDSE